MEIQSEAQNIVPLELGKVDKAVVFSFKEAHQILHSNSSGKVGIKFIGRFQLNEDEIKWLKLLPKAFDLNTTIEGLEFAALQMDDILVAEGLKAGFRKDKITCIKFYACNKPSDQALMEPICEGLQERSTTFQLVFDVCSPEFVKPLLEASYLKCFSLQISALDCYNINSSLKNLFYRGNLYYVSLIGLEGLNEGIFLLFGRFLMPNLTKLDLFGTKLPNSALKRLHGALKMILDSGRSNLFEYLGLGTNALSNKLSYAYFQLLRSDLVADFRVQIKEKQSRAVVKSISSIVAKTKNLRFLNTDNIFSSGTKFKAFGLQEESTFFFHPFEVNPMVV